MITMHTKHHADIAEHDNNQTGKLEKFSQNDAKFSLEWRNRKQIGRSETRLRCFTAI